MKNSLLKKVIAKKLNESCACASIPIEEILFESKSRSFLSEKNDDIIAFKVKAVKDFISADLKISGSLGNKYFTTYPYGEKGIQEEMSLVDNLIDNLGKYKKALREGLEKFKDKK